MKANELDPVVLAALTKGVAKTAEKNGVPVGEHSVDATITLRVLGSITKSMDTTYTPTADIPLLPTMALLLSRAGFTREGSVKVLTECMLASMRAGTDPADEIADRVKDIEAAMESVRKVIEALPVKVRAGAVRANVTVEVLSASGHRDDAMAA